MSELMCERAWRSGTKERLKGVNARLRALFLSTSKFIVLTCGQILLVFYYNVLYYLHINPWKGRNN